MSNDGQIAEAVYERREYPNCPPGKYLAVCAKTGLMTVPDDAMFDAGKQKITHRWEIVSDAVTGAPVSYIDKDDESKQVRYYNVFGKPLSISFGEKANLSKLTRELTGLLPLQDIEVGERTYEGGLKKKVNIVRFNQAMLENMQCILTIEHVQGKDNNAGRTFVEVKSYECTPAMKYENWTMLPQGHKQLERFDGFDAAKAEYEDRSRQPNQPAYPPSAVPTTNPTPPQPQPAPSAQPKPDIIDDVQVPVELVNENGERIAGDGTPVSQMFK